MIDQLYHLRLVFITDGINSTGKQIILKNDFLKHHLGMKDIRLIDIHINFMVTIQGWLRNEVLDRVDTSSFR